MIEQLLTEHLDMWTQAVETKSAAGRGSSKKLKLHGIAKLRELILELAVRGQLLPQDDNDEPASVLLERIAAERERLVKEKKIKRQKKPPEVQVDEVKFELPVGWAWTRLGNIAQIGPRNDLEDDIEASFVPMPLISTSYKGAHGQEVRKWGGIKKAYTHFRDGDIGLAKITPCFENSKAAVFSGLKNGHGAGTTELHVARPFGDFFNSLFVLLYLKAPQFLIVGQTKMTGSAGQKRVPRDFFVSNPLPLPPIQEQNRIVAKVDELMALCDALEREQESSIAAHEVLVENLLAALTNAADKGEFKQAWARVAEHFDTLFTTERSVDQLKQTMLQLAVMGKLVEQDPTDEPAGVLLERIAAEKARLVKEKKIKKQKVLPEIGEEEKVFELPVGWEWCRLGDLAISTEYGLSEKTSQGVVGVPVLAMGNIQDGAVHPTENKVVPDDTKGLPELYLKNRDVLYNRTNSAELVGKTGLFLGKDDFYTFASYLIRINLDKSASLPEFVNINMMTPLFRSTQIEPHLKQQCGQANVNGTIMKNMVVPIAPEEEQKRIVTMVDQLMAFCDQLKVKIRKVQNTQIQVASTLTELAS